MHMSDQTPKPISLRLLSNGYGEDLIGSHLAKALLALLPNCTITAYPIVGSGLAYQKAHIQVGWQNPTFPSGGFIRNLKDLFWDLKAGLIRHHLRQINTLKKSGPLFDVTLCVGDIFCLLLGQAGNSEDRSIFLPTAKSNNIVPHTFLERILMKEFAHAVYTRDEATAHDLASRKVPAFYLGNVMMDDIVLHHSFPLTQAKTLALLPGSREEAYTNLEAMADLVTMIQKKFPLLRVLVAKASSLDQHRLEEICKKPGLQGAKISENFWDILSVSHAVLGLSGTANEQAVYVGKTVICFPGTGPQSTAQRFHEQHLLLGEKLQLYKTKEIAAAYLCEHLKQTDSPVWLPPTQSAAHAIAQDILKQLPSLNPKLHV